MGTTGFYLFGRFIAYYGFSIAVGVIVAAVLAYFQIRRHHLGWYDFVILSAVSALCGILGAKLLYLLVSLPSIDFAQLSDLDYLNTLMTGGFVFYGGLIGALFGFFICKKAFHIRVSDYFSACMGCVPLAHGFGRIGCFLVGCCYGVPYHGLFAVTYRHSLFAPNHTALFPVQLAETIGNFVIAGILFARGKKLRGNTALYLYVLLYSVLRFALEFFRYDAARGMFWIFSTSQIISMIGFVAAAILLLYARRRLQVDETPDQPAPAADAAKQ